MTLAYTLKFLSIILSVTIADFCWTYYLIKVNEGKSIAAGCWSALIVACGAFTVQEYTKDNTLIFAAIIGGFIGVVISIEYNKWRLAKKAAKQIEK